MCLPFSWQNWVESSLCVVHRRFRPRMLNFSSSPTCLFLLLLSSFCCLALEYANRQIFCLLRSCCLMGFSALDLQVQNHFISRIYLMSAAAIVCLSIRYLLAIKAFISHLHQFMACMQTATGWICCSRSLDA